ncbi:MAG: MarR family transcriptional regulator [Bacteroidota bacterium]|jgi:MarR family 2-MHQ and catechol resistance regulon transcriptional repressor
MKTTEKYGKKADLALSLWVKLARASDTIAMISAKDIAKYNVTVPQFGVIESLGHLGPMTIGKICSKKLMSGGNMTVVVDNLEKEGYVERISNPDDRRSTVIKLTSKGESKFSEMFPSHARHIEELCSVLTEEEQIQLSELLKKLGTGLKNRL